jgi:hypothetical protein
VEGIRDSSNQKNPIFSRSGATLGFKLSVPIDAVWTYNQSGQDLGTLWQGSPYDDSGWPLGQGLFYVASAPLPAPKNTSLFAPNGRALLTYYFRKSLTCPITSSNVTATFRHVVDDGIVLYMNSAEFHRFNMPSGAINFSSLTTLSVGNADFSQTYTQIFTNMVSGQNLLAAEIHQATSTSADACFGAEFTLSVPSLVLPIPVEPPAVHITAQANGGSYLFWNGNGQILEESPTIAPQPQWKAVRNQTNPFLAQPTNDMRFYRLRR